jgi:hypothetical protein
MVRTNALSLFPRSRLDAFCSGAIERRDRVAIRDYYTTLTVCFGRLAPEVRAAAFVLTISAVRHCSRYIWYLNGEQQAAVNHCATSIGIRLFYGNQGQVTIVRVALYNG